MLDALDLVHMNGRVYDPLLARFVSPDPLVQDPFNGQSYNRYSYVLNNPTKLTDPTGFASVDGNSGLTTIVVPGSGGSSGDGLSVINNSSGASRELNRAAPRVNPKSGGITNKTSVKKDRKIVSDVQKIIGESNNGEIKVYERIATREEAEPESERKYGTPDEVMGQWFDFDLLNQLGHSAGASESQLVWLSAAGILGKPSSIIKNWRSVKKFGHAFLRHGEGKKITERLIDRAKRTGTDQGQWFNNEKAAEFLSNVHVDGPASIRIPAGLGQVIKPDGTILKANDWARVVPTESGFSTAFPIMPRK